MATVMGDRKVCPNGHAGVTRDDNFCWMCGVGVVIRGSTSCTCGYAFGGAEHYCPKCGVKVDRT